MTYTATITSQGQVSIPADLRKKYRLDKNRYLIFRDNDGRGITMNLVPDLLTLAGSLKTKKRLSIKQEKEIFAKAFAAR